MYSERYVFLNSQYIYLKTILEYSKYSLLRIVALSKKSQSHFCIATLCQSFRLW